MIYKILVELNFIENLFNKCEWSSTETTLEPGQKKSDFDKDPVLRSHGIQLKKAIYQQICKKN